MAKTVDWGAVELDYRAGIKSNRQIGREHNISDVAVLKRARREGWTKDLNARIRAKAEEKVSRKAVSGKVSSETANEQQIVEANATLQANLLLAQRADIGAARKIVNDLFGELGLLGDPKIRECLRALAAKTADNPLDLKELMKSLNAAIELPGRAIVVQKLTASLATLIDKERQAFGLNGKNPVDDAFDWLRSLPDPCN